MAITLRLHNIDLVICFKLIIAEDLPACLALSLHSTTLGSLDTAVVASSQGSTGIITLAANVKCFNLTYNSEIHLTFSSKCNYII